MIRLLASTLAGVIACGAPCASEPDERICRVSVQDYSGNFVAVRVPCPGQTIASVEPPCQPVAASAVKNDSDARCREMAAAQVQIRTEDDSKKFMTSCLRQMAVQSWRR